MDLPIVLDVEASGLGRGSYPIEVGVALADGRSVCLLVRPESGWRHWDQRAERLHGIARETLLRRGRSALEVARELNRLLAGQVVYSDAWGNDHSWLALLFDAAGCLPSFRLEALRGLLGDADLASWHTTRLQVERQLRLRRHRASADALILQETWRRCRQLQPTGEMPRSCSA